MSSIDSHFINELGADIQPVFEYYKILIKSSESNFVIFFQLKSLFGTRYDIFITKKIKSYNREFTQYGKHILS